MGEEGYNSSGQKAKFNKEITDVMQHTVDKLYREIRTLEDSIKLMDDVFVDYKLKTLKTLVSVIGTIVLVAGGSIIKLSGVMYADHIMLTNIRIELDLQKTSPSRNEVPFTILKTQFHLFKEKIGEDIEDIKTRIKK